MKNIIKFTVLAIFSSMLISCSEKGKEYADIPPDTLSAIKANVRKNFPENKGIIKMWVDRQVAAYRDFIKINPTVPLQEYSKIVKYAKDVIGDDYITLVDEIESMMYLAEQYNDKSIKLSQEDATFCKSLFNDTNAIEFKACLNKALEWVAVFEDMKFLERRFDSKSFAHLKNKYKTDYRNSPNEVMSKFYEQSRAMDKVNEFRVYKVPEDSLKKVREEIAQKYPHDFVAQFSAIEKYDYALLKKEKKALSEPESEEELSLRAQAEQIFRECVFTRHGEGEHIDVAVLVKLNGKSVILCDKNFIPQKWPVIFGNSLGSMTCSKGFISEEYPLVVLVPDEEPKMFNPIEIISPEESRNIAKKELYMIAPKDGGFTGKPVKVFSEDLEFLNLTEDDTPKTKREIKLKQLRGKLSDKILVSVIDKYDVGEHAIVFEPKTRKLVSVALRYYQKGFIEGNKIGNVLGHESGMSIPDFVTMVRKFDGNVHRTMLSPNSSVRFVRMTAMKDWTRLDIAKFWKQKNAIRKYTDANNEYIKFIKGGCRYNYYAYRDSARISKIVTRYKNDLVDKNLSSDAYNARYRAFLVDIINSMRFDMNRLGNSSFTPKSVYSIYRGEVAYLMELRKTMHRYMQESFKDGKLTARYIE